MFKITKNPQDSMKGRFEVNFGFNYNLRTIAKVVAGCLIAVVIMTSLYYLWKLCKFIWMQAIVPTFCWIASIWVWLLSGALVMLCLYLLWRYRDRIPKLSKRAIKVIAGVLVAIALVVLSIFCFRGCSSEQKVEALSSDQKVESFDSSFHDLIVVKTYLDYPVYLKFKGGKKLPDNYFIGMDMAEIQEIVREEYQPMVEKNLNVCLSENQYLAYVLAILRFGPNGTSDSKLVELVNEGLFAEASQWLCLQNGDTKTPMKEEATQYFYVLRLLWEGRIDSSDFVNFSAFSYKNLSIDELYTPDGEVVFNKKILEVLKSKGDWKTPIELLKL